MREEAVHTGKGKARQPTPARPGKPERRAQAAEFFEDSLDALGQDPEKLHAFLKPARFYRAPDRGSQNAGLRFWATLSRLSVGNGERGNQHRRGYNAVCLGKANDIVRKILALQSKSSMEADLPAP